VPLPLSGCSPNGPNQLPSIAGKRCCQRAVFYRWCLRAPALLRSQILQLGLRSAVREIVRRPRCYGLAKQQDRVNFFALQQGVFAEKEVRFAVLCLFLLGSASFAADNTGFVALSRYNSMMRPGQSWTFNPAAFFSRSSLAYWPFFTRARFSSPHAKSLRSDGEHRLAKPGRPPMRRIVGRSSRRAPQQPMIQAS
jgi:hypothetical protein